MSASTTPVLWHASIHSTQDLLTHLEPLIVASNRVPACADENKKTSCLARLSEKIGLQWNDYPQSKMCSACAASWALQVARNHLLDARRGEILATATPTTKTTTKERP